MSFKLKRREPEPAEVRKMFEEAREASPCDYDSMCLDSAFYGFLVGKGWPGADAMAYVKEHPVSED